MHFNTKDKKQLKTKAHKLRPIVLIGNNGLTDNVNMEVDRALCDHELIKMRINLEDRVARRALFQEICDLHKAELVQTVGKIGVLYRKNIEN